MNNVKEEMKRLLIKLILFLSPLLTIFLLLEYQLSFMPNKYSYEKANLKNRGSMIELLILGSSNAQLDLDPSLLSVKGFNLANTSQSLYYDKMLLRDNIDLLPNLKLVILSVSYLSFEYNLSKSPEFPVTFYYEHFLDIPPESKDSDLDLRRYSLVALFGLGDSLSYISKPDKSDLIKVDENGYWDYFRGKKIVRDWISDETGKRRVAYHHSLMHTQFIPENTRHLEDMISLLKSKGIISVIITPPTSHTYYDHIDTEKYQMMQEKIKSLQQMYQVKYFNYFKDHRFTINDFGDNDHLNTDGAKKFSKIVNDEVVAPILEKDNN